MANLTPLFQRTPFIDGSIPFDDPVETTDINSASTPETALTGQDAVDLILIRKPELSAYLDRVTFTPTTPITDILEAIQDLADADEDDTVDISTIDLSDELSAHLFIEQLADIAIPASDDTRITIESDGRTLLDDIYTPGLDGYIHLDLREFVLENTAIGLSNHRNAEGNDFKTYYEQDGSGLSMEITTVCGAAEQTYHIWANAFAAATLSRMSDIDRIDIPSDALIPMTVFRDNELNNAPVEVFMVTATRRILLHTGAIGDGDGYLISTDIPVSRIPYRAGEPFYLEFRIATNRTGIGQYSWRTVRTPVYRVTPEKRQQYLFLNDYGNYDLVPMSGAMSLVPEYELENSFRTYDIERAKATRHALYTQNSGPLSRQTATALSSLLLSRRIYIYTPGEAPRRIVIESPSVNISTHNPVNTVTFSWRFAEI